MARLRRPRGRLYSNSRWVRESIKLENGVAAALKNPLPLSTSIVGVAVDMVLLYVLLQAGIAADVSAMVSLAVAAVGVYLLGVRAGIGSTADNGPRNVGRFALVILLVAFLRAGILAWMQRIPGCPATLTAAVAAAAAGVVIWAAMAIEPGHDSEAGETPQPWHNPVIALLIYAVLLRLVYLGLPELIFEEAYYWNYSRHLALGYLDHPPMVAWIIRGFTALLGHTELGVRAGAFFSWLVGAWFVFKLARRIYDTATAVSAVLLFAVLPVYFGIGMTMSPDAPLIACWAGALYFLYLALIDEAPAAWLGAGLFLGAGMLSKYTIALLGAAVGVYMLTDSRARRWFRRLPPYVAAGIALLVFSPVILWNFQNHWMSFAFQGPRRAGGSFDFDLPALLGGAAVLLTPVGLAAAAVTAFSRMQLSPDGSGDEGVRFARGFRLLMLATLVPLSVFVFFSLFRHTKVNWTGPLWLGVLPFIARMIATPWPTNAGRWRRWLSPRTWRTTAVVLLLVYGAGLQYLVLGLWGLPYAENKMGMPGLGWPDLAAGIETVVEQVQEETGVRPLVVGMNVNRLSSWLAFYRSRAMADETGKNSGAGAVDTAGPDLFGPDGRMYGLWFPSSLRKSGRPMILVGDSPKQLDVTLKRRRVGPLEQLTASKNRHMTWHIYYRVIY
jgi:dolichol-phosphate mannosyltransferase